MAILISPAGNLEKLKHAAVYGADAVYLAAKDFGMRSRAGNFTLEEMEEGIAFAHRYGAKVEVAINIAARDSDLGGMLSLAQDAAKMGVDGIIAADPGLISILNEKLPKIELILSTQSNTTNSASLEFWRKNGVSRIVMARELSLSDLEEIAEKKPEGMQIEVFVHGAMCISYSGRCLLSSYMAGRDSNRGECAQPCRWSYALMEEQRPGEYFPIQEDSHSTYILSSKDLCLIRRVPELINMGVDAFKIEGRMKSAYYAAAVTNAYRMAITRASSAQYAWDDLNSELGKVSHRQYTEAFIGDEGEESFQHYGEASYDREYEYSASVVRQTVGSVALAKTKNPFAVGETLECLTPGEIGKACTITEIISPDGNTIQRSIHPNEIVGIKTDCELLEYDILRKPV